MFKHYLFLITCLLVLGCEVRLKDSPPGSGLFGRSSGQDTSTVFRITKPGDRQITLSETQSNTTVNAQVLSPEAPASMYEIVTPYGNMRVRLYNDTPVHRENFKKLVTEGFFDGTTFHRVIGNYMVQGGDPYSRDNDPNNDGIGGPGYTLESEFTANHFHKRGALAAARQRDEVNPLRRSNGSQFYIVQGRTYSTQELTEVEQYIRVQTRNQDFQFSPQAREAYTNIGGAPTLDMQYTVFGELVDGFDVLDRISSVTTDGRDRPRDDIPITIREVVAL